MERVCHFAVRILLIALFPASGFSQSVTTTIRATITRYAGPPFPLSGAQATTQTMDSPDSVAPDGAGGVYVASRILHIVFRVTADGTLRVIAGTGTPGFSGDGGPAVSARLNTPLALAVDSAGNLFIADSLNSCVRKVTPAGIISTVAGGPAT